MSDNRVGRRSEIVTIVLKCGHSRRWILGEHPRRGSFVLCIKCNSGVHVGEIIRGKAA